MGKKEISWATAQFLITNVAWIIKKNEKRINERMMVQWFKWVKRCLGNPERAKWEQILFLLTYARAETILLFSTRNQKYYIVFHVYVTFNTAHSNMCVIMEVIPYIFINTLALMILRYVSFVRKLRFPSAKEFVIYR